MPRFRHRSISGIFPTAAAVALLGLIAYRGAVHFDALQSASAVQHAGAENRASNAGADQQPGAIDYSRIAGLHLFGEPQAPDSAPTPQSVPETRLNLTLHGVLLDQEVAAAIIGDGKQQRYVRVGERMPGGGILRSVRQGQVVFERDGANESLRFRDLPGTAGLAPVQSDVASGAIPREERQPPPPQPGPTAEGSSPG